MRKHRDWKKFSIQGLLVLFFIYFTYHLFQGERGLISMMSLKTQIKKDQAILEEQEQKKADLEHQVSLLRPDSLDLDMLEERARTILNYAYPEETIVKP